MSIYFYQAPPPAPGGGVLAVTETPDAASIAGAVIVSGALAASEAQDSASFTTSNAGSLAATEAADVAAFSVAVATSGSLAAPEAPDTASFTDGGSVSGTLAATEGSDTASFLSVDPTAGQTVLSNHGPGGSALSRKKFEALQREMAAEKAAKTPIKAKVTKAPKANRSVAVILDTEDDDMEALSMLFGRLVG